MHTYIEAHSYTDRIQLYTVIIKYKKYLKPYRKPEWLNKLDILQN